MPDRPRTPPDHDVLSDPLALRVLARASELDAARSGGHLVPDLRAAAAEAGISPGAFEAALAEAQDDGRPRGPAPSHPSPRRRRSWRLAVGAAALLAAAALAGTRARGPGAVGAQPEVATVEEAILLRCLTPGEAAALVRPVLRDPSSQVLVAPTHAPRVLTMRATPALLQSARALLAEQDAAGSAACAPRPTSP